jgi:hypothetical protein
VTLLPGVGKALVVHSSANRWQPPLRWPRGHSGLAFADRPHFETSVTSFLVEGVTTGERLMLVADDPNPGQWPRELLDRGDLLVMSTGEVYDGERTVDPAVQRAWFEAALTEALLLGYTGLRVAADNTSLTLGPGRLTAWLRWEAEADRMMREAPITGLCAFDQTRTGSEALRELTGAHARCGRSAGSVPHGGRGERLR